MDFCGTCARETCDVPTSRDPNSKYAQGDVYGLRESVYTPIYDILQHTFSKAGGNTDALKRAQRSFNDVTSVPRATRSIRPAIIMEEGDDDNGQLGLTVHQHLYTLLRTPGWLGKRSKEPPEA